MDNTTDDDGNATAADSDPDIFVSAILASLLVLALVIIALLAVCICMKRRKPHVVSNHTIRNEAAPLHLDNPAYNGKVAPKLSPKAVSFGTTGMLFVSPLENPLYMGEEPVDIGGIRMSNSVIDSDVQVKDEASGSWKSEEEEGGEDELGG